MMDYPRFLIPGFEPYDPLDLAKKTEAIVTRISEKGPERRYFAFYSAPVYRGIATGYAAGCNLRCIYCWANWSRDYPEKFGEFYSPEEVANKLFQAAKEGITDARWKRYRNLKVKNLRLSGCEPTLGKDHLLAVLELINGHDFPFILETNGIILGADRDYVRRLAKFKDMVHVRVSLKAALPESFARRTGAKGEFYQLPFVALKNLLDEGISASAAAMTDPAIMTEEERNTLAAKLKDIDPSKDYLNNLEEEKIFKYDNTAKRMKASLDPRFAKKLEEEILRSLG